jgi:hypothetical protein
MCQYMCLPYHAQGSSTWFCAWFGGIYLCGQSISGLGFRAGLAVAQISECSLILAALGLSLGHLDQSLVGLVTLVGLITISASTCMIPYSHELYARLGLYLGWFERKVTQREMDSLAESKDQVDLLMFGLGRLGSTLANMLRERGCRLLAIDLTRQSSACTTRKDIGHATGMRRIQSSLPRCHWKAQCGWSARCAKVH